MTGNTPTTLTLFNLSEGITLPTHKNSKLVYKTVPSDFLELEDGLFNLNSAVLMPDNKTLPTAANSKDKTDQTNEETETGIRALAFVLKQFEFNNKQKILIVGHTDTSGSPEYNFGLSRKRALGVLYLVRGNSLNNQKQDRSLWARLCESQHTIEDYQKITKYFSQFHEDWNCDPGKIDNIWGPKTEAATRNYFTANRLNPFLPDDVAKDKKHRWPFSAWEKTYDLYEAEMSSALGLSSVEDLATYRNLISYLDTVNPVRGCGESFPIDQTGQDGYRSKKNRRVEVLFFNDEFLSSQSLVLCPPPRNTVHEPNECPLWHKSNIRLKPLDPTEITFTAFHIKFRYYDRIKKAWGFVPDGLQIRAEEETTKGVKPISTVRQTYSNDTYIIKVPDNQERKSLVFSLDNPKPLYVFTKSIDSAPEVIPLPNGEFKDLPLIEQQNYYDLPTKWSAQNYWVRENETNPKGNVYSDYMKNKGLVPYGSAKTSMSAPLIFSFDDIVLATANSGQAVKDKDQLGKSCSLSSDSRLALLYLNPNQNNNLTLYKPRNDAKHFSSTPFLTNLIYDTPPAARIVFFCSGLYQVTRKRTLGDTNFDPKKGHVLGARAAILDDTDVHYGQNIHVNYKTRAVPPELKDYCQHNCGNYELHYCHDCGEYEGKPLAYLIVYWNCRFRPCPDSLPTLLNWQDTWLREAMSKSMARTNRPYLLQPISGSATQFLKIFHYYEAKLDHRGGTQKCWAEIATARPTWMSPLKARFHQNYWKGISTVYSGLQDVDLRQYDYNAVPHECGHATGCFDDYCYALKTKNTEYRGIPSCYQPYTASGAPYSIDYLARMNNNLAPRMRNFWHFINWLNDNSPNKLNGFLHGEKFKLTFDNQTITPVGKIELDLTDSRFRDTSKPAYSHNALSFGNSGLADLFLYKTGGETSYTIDRNHVYDGILVIRFLITVDFDNGFFGVFKKNKWDAVHKTFWLRNKIIDPMARSNRLYLLGPEKSAFKEIKILLKPFIWFKGAAGSMPSSGPHLKITVNNSQDKKFIINNRKMEADNATPREKIIAYLLGKNDEAPITKTDLKFCSDWVSTTLGPNNEFRVEDV